MPDGLSLTRCGTAVHSVAHVSAAKAHLLPPLPSQFDVLLLQVYSITPSAAEITSSHDPIRQQQQQQPCQLFCHMVLIIAAVQ